MLTNQIEIKELDLPAVIVAAPCLPVKQPGPLIID